MKTREFIIGNKTEAEDLNNYFEAPFLEEDTKYLPDLPESCGSRENNKLKGISTHEKKMTPEMSGFESY